jgi:hypothetical protein
LSAYLLIEAVHVRDESQTAGAHIQKHSGHLADTIRAYLTAAGAKVRSLTMSGMPRTGAVLAIIGLAVIGIAALPTKAEAWWRGGWWCCGVRFGVVVPPVVIGPPVYAPPPVYYPPPVAYAPPPRAWIPPHWEGGYWVPGHWS